MTDIPTTHGVSATVYLILIQVFSRGVTFVGNQAILRWLSPNHLGLAVQLETLSISVLYTSRESLRVALQRPGSKSNGPKSERTRLQAAVNASYLVPALGLVLGTSFGLWYFHQASEEVLGSKDLFPAFLLYCLATVIELVAEPGIVIIQQRSLFRDRARAETTAAISRCIAASLTTIYMYRNGIALSVLPFAVGQVTYALAIFSIYFWSATKAVRIETFSFLPTRLQSSDMLLSLFPKDLLSLATALYGQSIFKWLLTQGDVLVLSLFADLQSQGTFALASNYGGLASRLLFQPVEESSRNTFGNLLSAPATTASTPKQKGDNTTPDQTAEQQKQRHIKCQRALSYLSTTLRAYILLVAIPSTTLLPHIFPLAVQTLLGSRSEWSSTQTHSLLAAYSYYIPCLAINGILDAFVTSTATEKELGLQSLVMLVITVAYLTAAYVGIEIVQLGAVGLVYANILNMMLRTLFSLWFIQGWTVKNIEKTAKSSTSSFEKFCRASVPSIWCLLSAVVVAVALHMQSLAREMVKDIGGMSKLMETKFGPVDLFGASYLISAGIVLASSIVLTESEFLMGSLESLLPQRIKNIIGQYLPARSKKVQ